MKEQIIQRLLEEGHITITLADCILNHTGRYCSIIDELSQDGNIDYREAIILLKKNDTLEIPFGTPNPYIPPITPYTDWTWDPNRPGTPRWEVTCTGNLKDETKQ